MSVSKKERLANLWMYDESLSYAVHVTHQFRTPHFKYAPAPLPDYGTVEQKEKKERSPVFVEYQVGLPKRAVKSRLFRVIGCKQYECYGLNSVTVSRCSTDPPPRRLYRPGSPNNYQKL